MLRWARGMTKKDHIKKRLLWYGHVFKDGGEDTTKKMQGKRRSGT